MLDPTKLRAVQCVWLWFDNFMTFLWNVQWLISDSWWQHFNRWYTIITEFFGKCFSMQHTICYRPSVGLSVSVKGWLWTAINNNPKSMYSVDCVPVCFLFVTPLLVIGLIQSISVIGSVMLTAQCTWYYVIPLWDHVLLYSLLRGGLSWFVSHTTVDCTRVGQKVLSLTYV